MRYILKWNGALLVKCNFYFTFFFAKRQLNSIQFVCFFWTGNSPKLMLRCERWSNCQILHFGTHTWIRCNVTSIQLCPRQFNCCTTLTGNQFPVINSIFSHKIKWSSKMSFTSANYKLTNCNAWTLDLFNANFASEWIIRIRWMIS